MQEEYLIIYAGGIIRDLYNAGGIVLRHYNLQEVGNTADTPNPPWVLPL